MTTDKLFKISDFVHLSRTYIESGTCYGASLSRALDAGFEWLMSIEAYEPFYQASLKRFDHNEAVRLYYGKSPELLPIILRNIHRQTVIFLDAHPAGPGTAGHDDLMEKGDASEFNQDTIIKSELREILKHRIDHVIIIDDLGGPDDPNASEYKLMLSTANPNYQFFWYDEQLEDGIFYKNKILVAIP
jgi:hypothetical protein